MGILVQTIVVSDFQQNARVLINKEEGLALIIDPGAEEQRLFDAVSTYDVQAIVLTHCHLDHAGAVQRLLQLFEEAGKAVPPLMYHSNEVVIAEHIKDYSKMYGLTTYDNCPKPDVRLDDLDTIQLGEKQFRLLDTPGHSPGHVALFYDGDDFELTGDFSEQYNAKHLLIAGDALFRESIGRTDLPLGNHAQLLDSIQGKLFTLADDTLVCPGHGPNTTIAHEKANNPFF